MTQGAASVAPFYLKTKAMTIEQQLERVRTKNLVKQHKHIYDKLSAYCQELTDMTLIDFLQVTDELLKEAEGA